MNDVRNEMKMTGSISLGQTEVRGLAGINSGRISLNDLKGKKSPWFKDIVDYYFETQEDVKNRISKIIAENNGELINKTFGFGDSVTELICTFMYSYLPNFCTKSTPKAIYANNVTNLYQCFVGEFVYQGKNTGISLISDELFKYCKNVENISNLFYGTPINRIPENIFEPFAKKVKDVSCCFQQCDELIGNVPDMWNKQKYPNVQKYEYYAGGCNQAANYNEILEGYK